MAVAKKKGKSPTHTKTGKVRLYGLNVAALNKMLESESKPKVKAKIRNAIARRTLTQQAPVLL
jgi:hypothetical protein